MTKFAAILICITSVVFASTCAQSADKPLGVHTDDTIISFALEKSGPVISGLRSASGGSYNWASGTPEAALPLWVDMDAIDRALEWKYAGSSAGKGSISFTYRSANPYLELTSTWSATPGPGPIEHSVTIRNRSGKAVVLPPVPTLALCLTARQGSDIAHWWIEKGAGYMPEDGMVHSDPVTDGYWKVAHCGPYSQDEDRDAIPWTCLHDAAANCGLYGGIEFSGWTETSVMRTGDALILSMGLQQRDGKTRSRINPGGSMKLPVCFIGTYSGDVDDGCNRLHRWVETHLRPPMPGGVTPVLVNNSWGSGMAVDEPLARRMIDDCADLGIELYHVDAGWYKDVGIWHSNPAKFPDGLEKIADYTHSKGLKFGLWVGWTQGGSHRDTGMEALSVFNPRQKDWFGQDVPQDWKNWEFTGTTVCLADNDARAWCLRDLRRMVKEYKLDLLEHDQPMILDVCVRDAHGHIPGDAVDTSRAACEGYYQTYDQLRRENPNLLFEDCVNGGRLVDYGVAKRVHYICVTDTYDQWTVRRAFYDNSYPLPPSMIELYLANIYDGKLTSFKSMLRSAMLGWATIMIDTTQWNAEEHAAAKKEFATYKERLRPLIASANFYHVMPRPNGKRWEAFQYHDPKTGRGAVYVFRAGAEEDSQAIKLKGLDPAARYTIESVDGSVSAASLTGRELMESGFTAHLGVKESSDLVFLTKI